MNDNTMRCNYINIVKCYKCCTLVINMHYVVSSSWASPLLMKAPRPQVA